MDAQMQQELLKRLDALSAKLGEKAGDVWNVLVLQTRVNLIQDALVIAFAVLGTLGIIKLWRKLHKMGVNNDDSNDNDVLFPLLLVLSTMDVILIGCAGADLLEIPGLLMNPQYYALHKLLDMVK